MSFRSYLHKRANGDVGKTTDVFDVTTIARQCTDAKLLPTSGEPWAMEERCRYYLYKRFSPVRQAGVVLNNNVVVLMRKEFLIDGRPENRSESIVHV